MNNYNGKKFSVLGDSISTYLSYSEPFEHAFYNYQNLRQANIFSVEETWWGAVIKELGGEILKNNSISGSTVCYNDKDKLESYACSDKRTSSLHTSTATPDVIMVYIGTNDFGMGKRISSEDKSDLTVFENAYKTMLKKLKTNYPSAEIWCVSLCTCTVATDPSFKFDYYWGGIHITEYNKTIKALAEELGCKFIDIYDESNPYDTMDEIHPNYIGMQTIKNNVLKNL